MSLKWRKWIFLVVIGLIPLLTGCEGCDKKKKYIAPPPDPFAPSGLIATAVSSTQIELIWTDNSTDEKGFYLYRRNSGSYRRIAALDSNTTSYSDTGLNPETTYWYKITSYNDSGESGSSNEASVKTMADVEILDYHIERTWDDDCLEEQWKTCIVGHVKNNTDQTLTIKIAGEYYSYADKWIALKHGYVWDLNPSRTKQFKIYHWGKTKIKYVKVWVDEYY